MSSLLKKGSTIIYFFIIPTAYNFFFMKFTVGPDFAYLQDRYLRYLKCFNYSELKDNKHNEKYTPNLPFTHDFKWIYFYR